jgi:hypothetical protein
MKTQYLQDLKLSAAKDALARGAVGPGGSRMTNMYGAMGEAGGELTQLPFMGKVGKALGHLTGGAVDRYGPAMGKSMLDQAARIQAVMNRSDIVQRLGKYAPYLRAAAARGPAALVSTNQMLMRDPEYRAIVMSGGAEEP